MGGRSSNRSWNYPLPSAGRSSRCHNFKFRPPFPALRPVTHAGEADFTALDSGVWGAEAVRSCSVCDRPVGRELYQVWISRYVGTDVLPFLVNACSSACVAALPEPRKGYIPTSHTGGPDIVQPASPW